MFLAIVSGIYRHDVLGIFSTMEKAKDAADAFFALEKDHYHEVEVIQMGLDKPSRLEDYGSDRPLIHEPPAVILEAST